MDSIGYAVSTKSQNKELAAKLAYTLSADEQVQRFIAQRGGQLPNIEAMARGEYLTDDSYFPESRVVFVNMLSGQNGKRVPTTYTYNNLWYNEAFLADVNAVWSFYQELDMGLAPMNCADYLNSIHNNAQKLLDEAIEDEEMLNPNS